MQKHAALRRGGRGVLGVMLCGLLYIGQANGRPVYDVVGGAVTSVAAPGTLQTETDRYVFEGSIQEQRQIHARLEARLSRRGFYRLWNRPLEMETDQLAEGWYNADTDQTVLCMSWATANGRAQQVSVLSGQRRRQLLSAS